MPEGLQNGLLLLLGIGAVLTIVVLVRMARRRRDPLPVLVVVGTLLCVVYEPIGDMLVLAYYPEDGQITWVTLFDRKIPLFIALMYLCYVPPFVFAFDHLRQRGFTRRSWWGLWAGTGTAIVAIELVVMSFGDAWIYYGAQRLVLGDLPIWPPYTYAAFLIATASGVLGLHGALRPRDRWVIVVAVPALVAGTHLVTSLPAAAALYSTDDPTLILLGALGSLAVCVALVQGLSRFFVVDAEEKEAVPVPA